MARLRARGEESLQIGDRVAEGRSQRSEERRRAWHEVWVNLERDKEPGLRGVNAFVCRVLNYSPHGLCVESPHFVRAGDVLRAERLGEDGGDFFLVRWVVTEGGLYRFGCRVISGHGR